MFVRIKKSGKHKYLQIVKNERYWNKVNQKVIASLGNLDQYMEGVTLNELGQQFKDLYKKLKEPPAGSRRKKKAA